MPDITLSKEVKNKLDGAIISEIKLKYKLNETQKHINLDKKYFLSYSEYINLLLLNKK